MVRLRLLPSYVPVSCHSRFNPTMVRLRRVIMPLRTASSVSFQSHYGAIATNFLSLSVCCRKWFQSHYGAIATLGLLSRIPPESCFNPTMVRLRLVVKVFDSLRVFGVSIPLWCDCDLSPRPRRCSPAPCFNPTMVRLRHQMCGCACTSKLVRFNPTMVRLRL